MTMRGSRGIWLSILSIRESFDPLSTYLDGADCHVLKRHHAWYIAHRGRYLGWKARGLGTLDTE